MPIYDSKQKYLLEIWRLNKDFYLQQKWKKWITSSPLLQETLKGVYYRKKKLFQKEGWGKNKKE